MPFVPTEKSSVVDAVIDVCAVLGDFFRSSEELLQEALLRQEQQIAYVEQDLVQATTDKK